MDQIAGHPYWQIHFDADGAADDVGAGLPDAVAATGVTDLFVMSHGWGTSENAAHGLYQAIFGLIGDAATGVADQLPTIGFVGVHWPSLWFPDPPADASAVTASAVTAPAVTAPDVTGAGVAAFAAASPSFAAAAGPVATGPASTAVPASISGADIAAALAPGYAGDDLATAAVARLGALVDEGAAMTAAGAPEADQRKALEEFHGLLGRLVTAHPHAVEDSGEFALITTPDPQDAYQFLADTMGTSAGSGDAQGLGDIFGKVWAGAKDALRVASYYEMKNRAGDVGRSGLGPLLERLHTAVPGVRVHLIGHSFGARLVAFSLAGISSAAVSPVASLCLVQGAFSHWSFAPDQPFGHPGALCQVADRVHGPLVATFSPFDWAVGRWYPKASLLSGQDSQGDESLADRWGGMGGDGFHGAIPSAAPSILPAGTTYGFAAGCFHSVDSRAVVKDVAQSAFAGAHSDIRHPEVAWVIVDAALPRGRAQD